MRFAVFWSLLGFPKILMVSRALIRKCCENYAFHCVLRATRLRFRVCFFVVFACSLFKNVLKTSRFHAFFTFPRPRHRPLFFHIRFGSNLCVFSKHCKNITFSHTFLIWTQTLCVFFVGVSSLVGLPKRAFQRRSVPPGLQNRMFWMHLVLSDGPKRAFRKRSEPPDLPKRVFRRR